MHVGQRADRLQAEQDLREVLQAWPSGWDEEWDVEWMKKQVISDEIGDEAPLTPTPTAL
jgi:hypothetical protein